MRSSDSTFNWNTMYPFINLEIKINTIRVGFFHDYLGKNIFSSIQPISLRNLFLNIFRAVHIFV